MRIPTIAIGASEHDVGALRPRYLILRNACKYSGLGPVQIINLMKAGKVSGFIYKSDPAATTGTRLVSLESLAAFLDAEAWSQRHATKKDEPPFRPNKLDYDL